MIENTVIMNTGKLVELNMLPESFGKASGLQLPKADADTAPESSQVEVLPNEDDSEILPLWQSEKAAIEKAIRLCQGNIPLAAVRLGVSPSTLYRKLKSWEEL